MARAYGRFFGPPLEIRSLEMAYGRQSVALAPGEEFELNPSVPIQLTSLKTNRWRNYDLRLFSPDFDIQSVTSGPGTLLGLLGEDYFSEPRQALVEVLEGPEVKAVFIFKGAFLSGDWALMGDAEIELERKIGYYRKALGLDPGSVPLFEKLSRSLAEAGKKSELSELLEGQLAKDPQGPTADEILNKLLALYQELGDKGKEISVLERLLSLAEGAGQSLEGLKTNLAALYRDEQPLKSARIYEELLEMAQPGHKRGYLHALIAIYRQEGIESLEIDSWERMLGLVTLQEAPAVWSELLGLNEKIKDEPGQREAWAGLAASLPPGVEKANAYKRLGYLWYKADNYDLAEEAYKQALEHDKADPSLYLNLARLGLAMNKRESYLENLQKAWEMNSEPALARELALARTQDGLDDEAAKLWLALAEEPGDAPETVGRREEARERLLGILRPGDGNFSEEFEKRLYEFSKQKVEFYNLGVARFKEKKWDLALKAFQKAQELDADNSLNSDIRGYLMALYKEKGQTKEMLDQAMLQYKFDPKRKESRDLVVAHLELDKNWKTLAEAAGFWTSWHPDDPDNWRFLALGQRNSGQESQAAKSLLKVAELEPAKAAGWLTAAEALDRAGEKESAKLAYEKALELEPNNAKAETALLRLNLDSLSGPNSSPKVN
jgi:tetratricopeptide (TPR) repeat protein